MKHRALALLAATLLAAGSAASAAPLPLHGIATDEQGLPTLAPLLENVTAAVVNISVASEQGRRDQTTVPGPFLPEILR